MKLMSLLPLHVVQVFTRTYPSLHAHRCTGSLDGVQPCRFTHVCPVEVCPFLTRRHHPSTPIRLVVTKTLPVTRIWHEPYVITTRNLRSPYKYLMIHLPHAQQSYVVFSTSLNGTARYTFSIKNDN